MSSGTRPLRVGVLGAGGIIAPAIVRDLAESEEVHHLVLLDLDEARAGATAREHGGPNAEVQRVDPHGGLGYLLTGLDVLVNSASYRVNLDAMRACLEASCHYIDLGGLYHLTAKQLELDDDFRAVGRLALLGMGSSPGKTNVMAARAVAELGTTPDAIDVYAAGRDLDPPAGPSYPYSPRTLVDELTEPPMALRGGEPVALEPMQRRRLLSLPGADRDGRVHLHAALGGAHLRRQLRLCGLLVPVVAGAAGAGAGPRAHRGLR